MENNNLNSLKKFIKTKVVEALSIPEKHQMKIAIRTLKMNDIGASIMGGMTKAEAREFLKRIGYSDTQILKLEQ